MLELQGDTARVDDETADRPEAAATGEEAPELNCPSCGGHIPDELVATGIHGGKDGCWNTLPTEIEACYAARPR